MKKVVLVLAHKDYRDEEYELTKRALEEESVNVVVASTDKTNAKGVKRGSARVDILLRDVKPKDFDGIVFIGGPGSKSYVGHAIASDLAREFVSLGKIVGAICYAPAILAEAGILSGKKATGWKTEENNDVPDLIAHKGGIYTDEPVVRDGNIVTADNYLASEEFGKTIAKIL